jgi:hypothetical protein
MERNVMRSFRFSIAGLMGLVVLAAIGSAGLANPMGPWTGILGLCTRALLCLAVVGAICRAGAERVWWLGFASFGWIYLGLPTSGFYPSQRLPTVALVDWLGPFMGLRPPANGVVGDETQIAFTQVVHFLWTVIAAVLGGFLATAAFGLVKDGLLFITSCESDDVLLYSQHNDFFQIGGHCVLALIAAGLGAAVAPIVCNLARGQLSRGR